jgi:hypothetical protein
MSRTGPFFRPGTERGTQLKSFSKRALNAAVLCLILAMPSTAGTLYNINFTLTTLIEGSPVLPTGSFAYDPVTGFSAFIVHWDGVDFDLTSSANSPHLSPTSTGCASRASTPQYAFAIMSEALGGCPGYGWVGLVTAGGDTFFAFFVAGSMNYDTIVAQPILIAPSAEANGKSSITAQTDAVPEPSSLGAVLFGTLAIAGKRHLQRKSK